MKKCLIIRYGAFGDGIMITPVLPLLKKDGYEITANVSRRIAYILENNPYIDKWLIHEDNSVPNHKLQEHWDKLSEGYDKVINFSESIEKGLLAVEGSPEFYLPKEERHRRYNVNYYERTLEIAGYKPTGKIVGELYFSHYEKQWAKSFRKKYKNKFIILWALSGSACHKAWPYTEEVIYELVVLYKNIIVITVGDVFCRIFDFNHPQIKNYSDEWGIRKSILATSFANLVVGPETGIINAAGCFKTPKIVFLSHSSKENLTKYFENCWSLYGDVECYPCHRLIYSYDVCERDPFYSASICMFSITPQSVLSIIENLYEEWEDKNGLFHRSRPEKVLCR